MVVKKKNNPGQEQEIQNKCQISKVNYILCTQLFKVKQLSFIILHLLVIKYQSESSYFNKVEHLCCKMFKHRQTLSFSISFLDLDPEATDEFNLHQMNNFQWKKQPARTRCFSELTKLIPIAMGTGF